MSVRAYSPAVIASRASPPDAVDFFPTPPWATRALIEHVIGDHWRLATCWEPAAGAGHMAEVLREYFSAVHASDIYDYGRGDEIGAFGVTGGLVDDRARGPVPGADWIITNPPFNAAERFAWTALEHGPEGAALLVRTAWLESAGRHERLFSVAPPAVIAQFVERVPMHQGRWDPGGSTATAYCWVVWQGDPGETRFKWIPPGQRQALERPGDRARFAAPGSAGALPVDDGTGDLFEREEA